tara:strand:- start:227 stop:730 length:504 start_codon:yes stop_codon:yes gene_type:complete
MDEDDDSEGWEETQYESLDWGDEEESSSSLVALYPATSKPSQAALVLIIAGFVLLGTATTMNGLLNDEEKIEGVTVKYNDVMGEMGIEIEQEEEIDEDFVRKILKFGMIWELVCAISGICWRGSPDDETELQYGPYRLFCCHSWIGRIIAINPSWGNSTLLDISKPT